MTEENFNEIREIVQSSERYEGVTLLDKEVRFDELFKDKDVDVVQVHSVQVFSYKNGERDIVGFCGVFSWKENVLSSLDGDSYSPAMPVIGYEWFETEEKERGVDILVTEW